ncbi:phosphate acetyltransferase [Companilactobacillus versmoldensis]|uniref:Phosphate acetyltransferase n=1 Tax=Companilactobacillus versmoldensis DSM 14857 = KCTC 3814 TaxID=1423815 RepID=A0A0R1SR57_9LACO|nr:phosphate acetyltransferase [Companilactobacillus versmoldensis]KRL67643.1 phosphate acetyltransferase [Companilactobacillus versmoldensis DSM 14857 = KCTC 3814]
MDLFESLKQKIDGKNLTIVFPEGDEPRILEAATKLNQEKVLKPILLGDPTAIKTLAEDNSFDLADIQIIDPNAYSEFDNMVDAFVERRKGKNTKEQAEKMLQDIDYFGTMLVYLDKADGMVSGAVHSTGDTVRPALQIVKTAPGNSRISGAFILQKGEQRYLFSDCAINIDPDAQELGEIAVQAAKAAKLFDIDPKVAMLSFSTKGSAKGDQVTKVAEATKVAQKLAPDVPIDGELQFDAAFVDSVAKQKAPDSDVAGNATVFVFPELQSGNIGYKIAQRFGGFEAVGPILLGLAKPISDLSRGCNADDVYKLAILTAAQAI